MIIDIGRVVLRLSVADGETVTDTSKSDANKLSDGIIRVIALDKL